MVPLLKLMHPKKSMYKRTPRKKTYKNFTSETCQTSSHRLILPTESYLTKSVKNCDKAPKVTKLLQTCVISLKNELTKKYNKRYEKQETATR